MDGLPNTSCLQCFATCCACTCPFKAGCSTRVKLHSKNVSPRMQAAAASKCKVDCMTNLALVAQKQRDFSECFRWCDKALRCVLVLACSASQMACACPTPGSAKAHQRCPCRTLNTGSTVTSDTGAQQALQGQSPNVILTCCAPASQGGGGPSARSLPARDRARGAAQLRGRSRGL